MIGMILTGHGRWAEGMYSAVSLLAGRPACFTYVNFLQEDSTDDLAENLRKAVNDLKPECNEGIVIFTDMAGDSPFKEAVEIKGDFVMDTEIEVIAGTNAGMLLQANMSRSYIDDLSTFVAMALEEGRKQIMCYEYTEKTDNEEDL